MRPIWKGAISFGMVTIPVRLYPAIEDKDVRFHLLHKRDLAPIEQRRFCSVEKIEVPWEEIVRGVETGDGGWVEIDPAEVEQPESTTTHAIEISDFVELAQIDPIYYEKTYLVEPAEIGAKPFLLLKRALEETGRVAVARVTIRTKERLAALRVYGDTLALETMYWPDEIRATSLLELPSAEKAPSERASKMARSLVESLSAPFDPTQHEDRYRLALLALTEARIQGGTSAAAAPGASPKVIDLMAALEASLKASKELHAKPKPAASATGTRRTSSTRREKAG